MTVKGGGRRVSVIGAGFSGLAIAHHLSRAGFAVDVREASPRAGGLLGTQVTERGLVETAANGILNSAWVEDLFDSAAVPLIGTSKSARARFLVRAGRPRRWPLGPMESVAAVGAFARFVLNRRSLAPREGESIRQWGSRVLSPSASRYTIETALQGIYAGDPERMSASLILGRFFAEAASSRSALPAPPEPPARALRFRGTVSAPGGMGQLIDGLRSTLENRGVRFHFGSPVNPAELRAPEHPIVVAMGAVEAAKLLVAADPERAAAIARIETLSIVTVTAHFAEGSLPIRGFGCLFPPREARTLGVLLNNHIFEGRAKGVLSETWILGGALFEDPSGRPVNELSDQEILNLIRYERRLLARGDHEPIAATITRWPQALPHFTTDLESVVLQYRPNRGNLFLLGNYTGGIGLAKILEQAAALPSEIDRSGAWNGKHK